MQKACQRKIGLLKEENNNRINQLYTKQMYAMKNNL